MGSLILCLDRHAAHSYEITRIHCRIFTIEELCYYLCNNLYLIDYTIMNTQLCDWLDEELGMDRLASDLRDVLRLPITQRICGKIRAHHPESVKNLPGAGNDPHPECSGASEKSERYRAAEI